MWSIDVSHIFVDYRCSDELFINSCFVIENVIQFHVLSPLKCNPNLFGHFFILTFIYTLMNMIFLIVHVFQLIFLCILL